MADSDLSEAEQLALIFKAGGLDVVKDAGESFKNLTEEMKGTAKAADQVEQSTKTVDTTTQQAIEVLATDGTVVSNLKTRIEELRAELNRLSESYKAGLIAEGQYAERSDKLIDILARKEEILERVTGSGDGESGTGGFKGMAAGVLAGEKAITRLIGGTGLGGIGGLLEKLTSLVGLASGTGLAIGGIVFAVEALLPKIEGFIEKMTGAAEAAKKATEALQAHEEQVKRNAEAERKLAAEPTREEQESQKEIKGFLGEGRTRQIKAGIAGGLEEQRFGLTQSEQAELNNATRMIEQAQRTGQADIGGFRVEHYGQIIRRLQEKRVSAIEEETNRLILQLPESPEAQQAVSGMARKRPAAFPAETAEFLESVTPEARQKARDEDLALDEIEALRQGKKTARFQKAREQNKKDKEQLERDDILAGFEIEEEDPDQQFMLRNRARREEHNRQVDDWNRQQRERRKADQERSKVARDSARQDRENMPEAEQRRAVAEEHGETLGEAQRQNQMRVQFGGMQHPAFEPSELQQVVGAVGRNRMMNSQLGFTLAQQVDFYMSQLEAKMVADFARGLGQQNRTFQNNGGP